MECHKGEGGIMSTETEQKPKPPHVVKAILIYSDSKAVEIDFDEMVRRFGGKGPVTGSALFFGVLWAGIEALGYIKRKEII